MVLNSIIIIIISSLKFNRQSKCAVRHNNKCSVSYCLVGLPDSAALWITFHDLVGTSFVISKII